MKKLIIYSALVFAFTAAGCSKFIDVAPKGKFIPKTVEEYELFINDVLLADASYAYCEFMTDDVAYPDDIVRGSFDGRNIRSYLWQKELMKVTEDDGEWNRAYSNIYICNLVLANIGTAAGGTPELVEKLKAEAKIHRAFHLFHLANLYGNAYSPATEATDLAAPIMLLPDLEAKPRRATVKEAYAQVLKDIEEALQTPALPDFGRNYVHPGKSAAMALLARVQLYMGNYEGALQSAEKALAYKSTLLDYNTFKFKNPARPYSGVDNRPTVDANPENIYTRTNGQNGVLARFMINPDLHAIIGEKDLRFVYTFTRIWTNGTPSLNPLPDYFANAANYSIGVPEMMLIKAEVLARNGKKDEAVALLNTLRQKRFKPADYVALTAATPEAALDLVLRERRIELMYHGLRWFDLKRLNKDARYKKDLSRTHLGVTYTLPAGSANYLLQIAPKIITINPGIAQNPRN